MPLMKMIYPSNTEFVLNILIDLTNFQMIPANEILKKIFKFLNDLPIHKEVGNEESLVGYSIDDFIENMA